MSEQNLKALKTLVISMGVVLVVGFIVTGAAAWMKFGGGKPPQAACNGGEIDLTGRGHVVETTYDKQSVRVVFAKASGEIQIVTIDLCTGKETGTVKIATDGQ